MKMADSIEEIGHGFVGSPARTRTTDMVVNSHPLYRLSYWGRRNQFFSMEALLCQYFIT